jgi:Tfp pilus assembly protein PilX
MNAARPHRPAASQRGAALVAVLCFAAVLAISLGSYITMCHRTLTLSTRSMQGAGSGMLAEAGLEDALWSLNKGDWSGWTVSGTTAQKTFTVPDGLPGVTSRIELTVTNYADPAASRTVTATAITEQAGGGTVVRTVQSTSGRPALFVNAVAATTGKVQFKSAGLVDSYDSSLGEYSAQTPGYSAVVSSSAPTSLGMSVTFGSTDVRGYVATTGVAPTFGSGARLSGPTPGSKGVNINTTRISTSARQPIFSEVVPTGAGTPLPGGTATIGTEDTLYYASDLVLEDTQVLTVAGPVVIVVSGNLSIAGTAQIRIASGASLRIHVAGEIAIGGNGIQNDTHLPKNCVIISSRSSVVGFTMATNTAFYGVIYTPNSNFTISNNQTIYGALVAMGVTVNQSATIHYDIALRNTVIGGLEIPFAIKDWRETTPAE